MAINTYGITLMHKGTGNGYTQLVPIKDFPDIGGSPELLETTTLSDAMQTYIEGIQTADALEFTANYTKADFEKIVALKGTETEFAIYFGADGTNGKWFFKGYASVRVNGGGVNEVVGMTISIAPSAAITTTEPTA